MTIEVIKECILAAPNACDGVSIPPPPPPPPSTTKAPANCNEGWIGDGYCDPQVRHLM